MIYTAWSKLASEILDRPISTYYVLRGHCRYDDSKDLPIQISHVCGSSSTRVAHQHWDGDALVVRWVKHDPTMLIALDDPRRWPMRILTSGDVPVERERYVPVGRNGMRKVVKYWDTMRAIKDLGEYCLVSYDADTHTSVYRPMGATE